MRKGKRKVQYSSALPVSLLGGVAQVESSLHSSVFTRGGLHTRAAASAAAEHLHTYTNCYNAN